MEAIKGWILTIAVCAIIIEILDILMPEGSMRKTAFTIFGIVLSLCIIMPATSIYDNLKTFDFDYSKNKENIIESRDIYTEEQMIKVTSEFKKKLTDHIEALVKKTEGIAGCEAEVIIEENYNSDEYGTINRIYITAAAGEKEEEQKNESGFMKYGSIEKIDISIDGIKIINKEDKTDESKEDERANKVREIISEEFDIDMQNIYVEVQDEKSDDK